MIPLGNLDRLFRHFDKKNKNKSFYMSNMFFRKSILVRSCFHDPVKWSENKTQEPCHPVVVKHKTSL